MIVLGLTGGIGMGKSAVTKVLQSKDIPVWDADKAVADLYEKDSGMWYLHGRTFRDLVQCRSKEEARDRVLDNPDFISLLGAAAAPFMIQQAKTFIADMKAAKKKLVVLDVPLLFESNWHKLLPIDATVTVSCSIENQAERVLARPGMHRNWFATVLANQMADFERRELATFIIDTNGELDSTPPQVEAVLLLAKNLSPQP